MLSVRRNLVAYDLSLEKLSQSMGLAHKIVIDRSGANLVVAQATNNSREITGADQLIEIRQVKYLNNILGQDRRYRAHSYDTQTARRL
ncbi:hypothetical protein H5024_20275 [Ochrobactrum sp. Marseille-Q0166]|nr:hypothetical protein [Ochrobactrum sp. Marseille-Q0166]